jgi:hypothetical protein
MYGGPEAGGAERRAMGEEVNMKVDVMKKFLVWMVVWLKQINKNYVIRWRAGLGSEENVDPLPPPVRIYRVLI